jgi:hypothetical protein
MPKDRPFEPQNIILFYDRVCASTCALFSESMTAQAGVNTVVIGGRPFFGFMQAVGGVKGVDVWSWTDVLATVNDTRSLSVDASNNAFLDEYTDLPFRRSVNGDGYVNVRDSIRQGDVTQTPLQFVYEPAGCRIFYTREMITDVAAIWRAVADVSWGEKACAT